MVTDSENFTNQLLTDLIPLINRLWMMDLVNLLDFVFGFGF
jgi:hypothetical protein